MPHDHLAKIQTSFGEIRSILQASPSTQAWQRITQIIDQTPEDACSHTLLPYIKAHISQWPTHLLHTPRHWIEALFAHDPPEHTSLVRTLNLSQRGLSDRDIKIMCDHASLRQIQHLDISHNWLMKQGVKYLCASPHTHALVTLDLSYNQLGDAGVSEFSQSNSLNNLASLSLARNDLSVQSLEEVSRANFSSSIEHIDLSNNWIRFDPNTPLALHHEFTALTHLSLASNQIKDLGLEHILAKEQMFPSLNTLNLRHTNLTGEAGRLLAWSEFTSQLTSLDLAENNLTNQGVHLLLESGYIRHLENLNLSNNQISDDALLAMSDTPHLESLHTLDLSNNWITHTGLHYLMSANNIGTLTHINLSNNQLEHIAAIQTLCTWPNLEQLNTLDLSKSDLSEDALHLLLAGLSSAHNLTTLILDHNRFTHDKNAQPFDLSQLPNSLRKLSLVNCHITDQTLHTLLKSPTFQTLDTLDLRYNPLGDPSASCIEHMELEQCPTIDIRYTNLTSEGAKVFAQKSRTHHE